MTFALSFIRIPLQQEDEEEALISSPLSAMSLSREPAAGTCRNIQKLISSVSYQLLIFTIPSFLRWTPRATTPSSICLEKSSNTLDASKKHSTDYLDGVRGAASCIVFIFHWTHLQYPGANTGYISGDGDASVWQLPILRFIYSGSGMVAVFFVVSGYVLTHRYIQKMYRHDYSSLYASLTSLAFRRALRLFLPSFGSVVLSFIFCSFGIVLIPGKVNGQRFHHGLLSLLEYMDNESNPWTWDLYMKGYYNPQLWSIALEYRGSMVVFLAVLGLARTRTSVRVAVESAIVAHAFGHRRWDVALFMAGMMIAELDVLMQASPARRAFMQKRIIKTILMISVIAGLWLTGYPRDHGLQSYGFGFLRAAWPFTEYRRRFWLAIGAILLVAPLPFMPSLQALFNTKPIRYLGRISFALYLVHGLGNRSIGLWLLDFTRRVLMPDSYWAHALTFAMSSALYIPIIFWWSDMFWRAVDAPSMHFAKWIEGVCAAEMGD